MAKKKILILNAHPRADSFCNALAHEYKRGAEAGGLEIQFVTLRDLTFDPILRHIYRENVLEPDLVKQQELIQWCDHLVIITPVWWLSTPALLKGYLDRTLTPGFAYKYNRDSLLPIPKRLLKGRSARVIYTQGGPRYLNETIGFDAFWKGLKYGTLVFCGFWPTRRTVFPQVPSASENKRQRWLTKAYQLGKKGK